MEIIGYITVCIVFSQWANDLETERLREENEAHEAWKQWVRKQGMDR